MKQTGTALALGIVALLLIVVLLNWTDPGQAELRAERTQAALEQARELAPLWLAVKRALLAALAISGLSIAALLLVTAVVAALSTPNLVRITWVRSWLVKPGRYGAQYPALATPDGQGHIRIVDPVGDPMAQRVAALTTGLAPDVRLQGSAVRQVLRQDDPQHMLPDESAALEVEPAQSALRIDPVEKPHWLIVGQTGSGKSTATRYIMAQLAASYRVEFVIAEPGGIDWNMAASAVTQLGIAEAIRAVYVEFERRQQILREADVAHISRLTGGERMPYVYLVVEEMEAVLDDLKVTDRLLQQETLINLRQIARMGRKPGIGLIAVTQAARTDVFDSHVRTNLANVLLFRNGQGTAEMFRVSDHVTLPKLPTGEAYSLAHGHRLAFPLTPRPDVPLSALYREPALLPDASTSTSTSTMALEAPIPPPLPDTTGTSTAESVSFEGVTSAAQLDARQRQHIILTWHSLYQRLGRRPSLTAVEEAAVGYSGGAAYYIVDPVLADYMAELGRPAYWRRS